MVEMIQCVPNFSEGRRQEVIDALVAACRAPGVALLDHHADRDHNRLVVTFVGDRAAVRDAALRAARAAMELIDVESHQGSHPRMGALDVLPFVPVRGVTMADCVALAEEVGRVLGEMGLPVYLYEEAARTPERRSLADVRRGEYEGLRADVAEGRRLPDFGPPALGRAGATAVGARKPLVAFNVNLGTPDVKVAKAVANRVREARGGLRNVRAIGLALEGRPAVQVSMNLVDTEATPIYRALELVRVEAARYGAPVVGTEVVGLAPQAALVDSAAYYLQLEGFRADEQVLENRVTEALLVEVEGHEPAGADSGPLAPDATPRAGEVAAMGKLPLEQFLEVLASEAPAPGGGSAAAVAGGMAAALVAMVARLSQGKRFAEVAEEMVRVAQEADALRRRLETLAEADTEAFRQVMAAYRLPKETEAEKRTRRQAIARALERAGRIPLETARAALELLPLATAVGERGNGSSASDAAAAAHLLGAAVEGALLNVEINAASLKRMADVDAARSGEELAGAVVELRGRLNAMLPPLVAACEARVRGTG
ncbi:glutamate formiminotransferase [Limnochorda pilosa]|uniref:Formimidoyltransferase-cyclodeaminase n=1 Tax=Limnochorda pilosa TaxID=1555112 RepID=A0A0K2SGA7_LIMPI|nr:glutamate formiminotransferase [Limnochorda pilosa]